MRKLSCFSVVISSIVFTACGNHARVDTNPIPSVKPEKIFPNVAQELELNFISIAQDQTAQEQYDLSVPNFNLTANQVKLIGATAIQKANRRLNVIARQYMKKATFESTFGALDDANNEINRVASSIYFIAKTSPSPEVQAAASEQVDHVSQWEVSVEYRDDLYKALKTFADTNPKLDAEQKKLVEDTLRDFKKAGMNLGEDAKKNVHKLRNELEVAANEYSKNIDQSDEKIIFTAEQVKDGALKGVPEDFIKARTQKTDGSVVISIAVANDFSTVMSNARSEETRKVVETAYDSMLKEKNTPLLEKMISLRHQIAEATGYKSWADYRTDGRMAGSSATVNDFLKRVTHGLDPKFQTEMNELKNLKARDQEAGFNLWDYRYYQNQMLKEKYNVDAEDMRKFFSADKVLIGMLEVYQNLFGLKFTEVTDVPYKWVPDIRLFLVTDQKTGEPLGAFYLDLFPRKNKYKHFAHFGIVGAKTLPNGKKQRPISALVCNFPAPTEGKPSLLTHGHVETMFHEFGHAMHAILSQSKFARFAGTGVERDFVEAPSQMLEAWVWEKSVLDRFAANWQNPEEKMGEDLVRRMNEAKQAIQATLYRRQMTFGIMDMNFHAAGTKKDVLQIAGDAFREIFLLPLPEGASFAAAWTHMNGYDAGYYGYAWADAISEDLLTQFKKAPGGMMDVNVGQKLREEIYSKGGTRPAAESIRAFLGRDWNMDAFFESLGISNTPTPQP